MCLRNTSYFYKCFGQSNPYKKTPSNLGRALALPNRRLTTLSAEDHLNFGLEEVWISAYIRYNTIYKCMWVYSPGYLIGSSPMAMKEGKNQKSIFEVPYCDMKEQTWMEYIHNTLIYASKCGASSVCRSRLALSLEKPLTRPERVLHRKRQNLAPVWLIKVSVIVVS